ncbi:MAG: hypothetical protein JXR37_18405 [Kiritimatiellae bacterium]|nr:hypothetical protein [Kiritimatiellia bacterium]
MLRERVMVLARGKCVDIPLYRAWTGALPVPCTYVTEYDTGWNPPDDAGLIVTAQNYEEPEVTILRRAMDRQVPCLLLADGILEYRNTWQNPRIRPGSMFQPVMAHKVAAMGRAQARFLESWGNLGKCEIVGAPRLDPLLGRKPRERAASDPFRIMVLTARTPGFTDGQLLIARKSLLDLKQWFERNPEYQGVPVEPEWRLTQGMDTEIGVTSRLGEVIGNELHERLPQVDALIGMASTSLLEAMLHGMPVALLDYHNCPHYVPAAWTITAPQHVDVVIPELLAPPAPKMLFQDTVLHDQLECRTAATPRMVQLVERMIRIAGGCRAQNRPLAFPAHVLDGTCAGHHFPEARFDLAALYPDHPVFSDPDRARLQVEVGHLAFLAGQRETYIRELEQALAKQAGGPPSLLRRAWQAFPGPRKLRRLWRRLARVARED